MRESIDGNTIKSASRAALFALASGLALANCSTTPPESDDWPDQELPRASALQLNDPGNDAATALSREAHQVVPGK